MNQRRHRGLPIVAAVGLLAACCSSGSGDEGVRADLVLSPVARFVEDGLLEARSDRLVLTTAGRLLADAVVRDLT